MQYEDRTHPSATPRRAPLNASGHSRTEHSNASIHRPTVTEAHQAELHLGAPVRLAPWGNTGLAPRRMTS